MRQVCYGIEEVQENDKIVYITISQILDFPNSPFQVRINKDLMNLVDSIQRNGVIVPAVVRPMEMGKYQMISGHRRKKAGELIGIYSIPCIVKELSDEDAIIFMVDSNFHREEILPSEKAFAYKMRLDAMKRRAGRPRKNNYVPLAHNFRKTSRKELADLVGESEDQIRRYIRLTELLPPLLKMVDEKVIALRPAVELSYLSKENQEILLELIEYTACTPSHAQAIRLRKLDADGMFDFDSVLSIMEELKANQKTQVRISKDRLSGYFAPGTPDQTIEDTIIKALELYHKALSSKEYIK